MKRRLLPIAALLLVALIAAALYFGPHWTLYRMRQALQARDAQALSSHVDFPALRESLKAQLLVAFGQAMRSSDGNDKANPFAALGQALAAGIVNPMVDAMVTPSGVMVMMAQGMPTPALPGLTPKPPAAAQEPAPMAPSAPPSSSTVPAPPPAGAAAAPGQPTPKAPDYTLRYVDFSTVKISAADSADAAFVLRRHHLFGWKLAAVELPALGPR